jgi:uncharacterized protein (DUF58 family)
MLSEGWLALIVLLLAISVALRQSLLFSICLLFLLAAGASALWQRRCLDRVEYRRHLSQPRAFFGEEVELTLELVNRKLLPLAWLEAEDEFPQPLQLVKGRLHHSHKPERMILRQLVAMRWYERVRRRYRVRCTARGHHAFGPVTLRSGDLFGATIRTGVLEATDWLLVYPKIVPLAVLGLPSRFPLGEHLAPASLHEDPARFRGVRPYTRGDSPRRIHWKVSAHTASVQVKLYEPSVTHRLAIFVNFNTLGPAWWWFGYDPLLLELAIVVAASLAAWGVDEKLQVGLYGNSTLRGTGEAIRIPPARHGQHLAAILEALARSLPIATTPIASLLMAETLHLPRGTTVVAVSTTADAELVTVLRALRARGYEVVVILVGDKASSAVVEGLRTYRVTGEEQWRELADLQLA